MVEGEAATPFVGLIPELGATEPLGNATVQVDTHIVLDNLLVVLTRLFQSQPKTGAASAKTAHEDPETDRLRLAL